MTKKTTINYQSKLKEMYLKYMPNQDFYEWVQELEAVYRGQRKSQGFLGIEFISDEALYKYAVSLEKWAVNAK